MKSVVLSILVLLTGCANSSSASSCNSERSSVTEFTGAGVVHTTNVDATVKDRTGRTIVPSELMRETNANGVEVIALYFYEDVISIGNYSVEITANNQLIETYRLRVRQRNSPVLTITCS